MRVQQTLSDSASKKLKSQAKKFKLGDGDKLWLVVYPRGVKSWHYTWKAKSSP